VAGEHLSPRVFNEYLFHVGDKADDFFFVAAGVLITSGVHPLVGAVHGQVNHPGQWFGEPAALSQRPRLGRVLARKSSTLVAVSFTAVVEELRNLPQVATSLFDLMANNTEEHMLHGLDLLIQNPRKRMCSRLLTFAGRRVRQPPPVSVSIPISQDELALNSCMSRQTVNQGLGEFVSDRICALRYGEISIQDTRKLAEIVSGD
jgi:CRP-like cAMP-binding protein